MSQTSQAKRWVFTLNNYTVGEQQLLADLLSSDHVEYGIIGRETGESGTPHLQGFIIFKDRKRFRQVKALINQRVHLEVSKGTPEQAATYCKKDGDFDEYGTCPTTGQGKRSDWERLKDWCETQTVIPSDYTLFTNFPSLYGRYKRSVRDICNLIINPDPRTLGEPRPWQLDLESLLDGEPDDRVINFVVDREGNNGKSWFARYYLLKHQSTTQLLSIGKRDDIAHALDPTKSRFFLDVPRGSMEFLQYAILEMIKNGVIFSPKYESTTKIMDHNSHVTVLCNEMPDMNKLTGDRYNIIEINPVEFHQPT